MTRHQRQLIDDLSETIYGDHHGSDAGDVLYALEYIRHEITEALIVVAPHAFGIKTKH